MPPDHRVAVVTGASRGIGAAVALRLARDGADVAITYLQQRDQALAVVDAIASLGRRAIAIRADAADPDAAEQMVEQVMHVLGRLDILVNNAGIGVLAPLPDLTVEMFDRLIAVNVRGVYAASRQAARVMTSGGRIVNIGSVNAERAGLPGVTGYAMTKSALAGLTRGMARDLGERGITVNLIQPGPIATEMNPQSEQTLRLLVVPRFGRPNEVAAAVAYLVSAEAAFVTGATLNIDGGYLS